MRHAVVILLFTGTATAQPLSLAGRRIEHIEVRGNQKLETDAIRAQLSTKEGAPLDPVRVGQDLRALWKMRAFASLDTEAEEGASGDLTLTFVVAERPAIRKVLVAGHRGLGLDAINDVLDLERGAIVDPAKVRHNRDKVAELYAQKGYYLASVDSAIEPAGDGEVDVRITIDERAKVRVRDIDFIGNQALSDDELRKVIATRRPDALAFLNRSGIYHRETFERDLAVVAAHYLDRGYATVKLGAPAIRLSRDQQDVYLAIHVDEGPRFMWGAIAWKGELLGTPVEHARRLAIRTGAPFSRSQLEADRHALAGFYQDRGYAYANVIPRPTVDVVHHRIGLTFEIERGKRAYFERIQIRGNTRTRDKVIRRELKLAEGELFSQTSLEVSKRRVMALGYFESVAVSTTRGSTDEHVVVNVEVTERPTGTFQIGAGLSSIEGVMVQGQVSQNNLFGRGQSLTAQAQLSGVRKLFLLRFVEPYFLDTPWTFAFDLYRQSRGFDHFARNASGGSLTWGYPLSYHARAFLTYKLEDVDVSGGTGGIASFGARRTRVDAADVANLYRGGLTSSLRGSLVWDSRDNRLFPTNGWYASAFAEVASKYTGSKNQFVRWGGFARYYRRLWGPLVWKQNLELGVTTSIDREGVPITERYLLGGIYDVRGYGPRSLGPRLRTQRIGDLGAPLETELALGGNLQVFSNTELEFPLVKRIGLSGVVFFDAGNTFNLEDRYCAGVRRATPAAIDPCFQAGSALGALRTSIGLGVRWQSPIGPLRLEWGLPLDLLPGEKRSGWDFTIGTSF